MEEVSIYERFYQEVAGLSIWMDKEERLKEIDRIISETYQLERKAMGLSYTEPEKK